MLNASSGTAARNGTNAHTVPLGFTSTAGSLLVFICHGAVTHTAAGWTEQLSPVTSGELSVFTKTSTGDSSITVTHNAGNYPITWAAIELAAGTAWVTGTQASAATDVWPALSGLPGTPVTVFGARARVSASPSESAASSTWNAPWVEIADQIIASDGSTDGSYLTAGYQTGVTATTATPDATTSWPWTIPDRQYVVLAVTEPAPGVGQIDPAGISVPVTVGAPTVGAAAIAPAGLAVPVAVGTPAVLATVPSVTLPARTYANALEVAKVWINGRAGLVGLGNPLRLGAHLKKLGGGEPSTYAYLEENLSLRSADAAENPDMLAALTAQVYGGTREAATNAAIALAEEVNRLEGAAEQVAGALLMVADDIQGPAWLPDGEKPRLLVNFTLRVRPLQ